MAFPLETCIPGLSGDRCRVRYRIQAADEAEAHRIAEGIALEQTVELPSALVPSGDVRDDIVGRIEVLEAVESAWETVISYAVETAGTGLTQLMNIVFGNTSMQPGIQVRMFELPDALLAHFRGPRFGIAGLRELLGVHDRPLLCTALKPMGLNAEQLAQIAYAFALGGIDVIKDDHGLANQPFCPFEERVARCSEAVERANRQTGLRSIYAPNVTAPHDEIIARARFARSAGAGGLLISWALTGFDAMRRLADDDSIGLPILAHPALSGSFVCSPASGISHYVTYGQLIRLAGGDASIFVSYGGRFPYTEAQCHEVLAGTSAPMGHLRTIWPVPSGGMTLDRLPELKAFYGRDTMFLIAGGLYAYGTDLTSAARVFVERVHF